ncbi:MAG: DNA primase [Kordiimonas sp.]|nr:DNA primase [Kordiimonas sp.]
MSFTPDFLDELRARLPLSDVVGRRVKLIRRGREHSGLCPFHNEKTPSFTVNDDKSFYHCFGCGAHGDVIKFVMETEGLSFPETIERLAEQAGLAIPESRPEDRERSAQRKSLLDVMELVARWYESQLRSQQGQEGLSYLRHRGLKDETIKRFRLGYAPAGRTALKDSLLARDGITEEMLVAAGMLIQPEEANKDSYDRFRHRVMFPICDRQGRIVAFGGRALDKDARAKYLNSPETTLFHKGRLLYNLDKARKAAFDHQRLLVAEGYMDVIALAQAGFSEAVAPLGTAVTEEQIGEMWRLTPEPTLCFDGDKAGQRAALRVVDRALPLLKPGYSLRFLHLPEGEDPDSFVQGQGQAAFEDLLAQSKPLADVLWRGLVSDAGAGGIETPEQRAGLEQKVYKRLNEIRDEKLKGYYRTDYRKRLISLLGDVASPAGGRAARWSQGKGGRYLSGNPSKLKQGYGVQGVREQSLRRERLLLLVMINHPELLDSYQEELAALDFRTTELDNLRSEIIRITNRDSDLERESLIRHLENNGYAKALEIIFEQGVSKLERYAWPDASLTDAAQGFMDTMNLHRRVQLEEELAQLEKELADQLTPENFARLQALKAEIEQASG